MKTCRITFHRRWISCLPSPLKIRWVNSINIHKFNKETRWAILQIREQRNTKTALPKKKKTKPVPPSLPLGNVEKRGKDCSLLVVEFHSRFASQSDPRICERQRENRAGFHQGEPRDSFTIFTWQVATGFAIRWNASSYRLQIDESDKYAYTAVQKSRDAYFQMWNSYRFGGTKVRISLRNSVFTDL